MRIALLIAALIIFALLNLVIVQVANQMVAQPESGATFVAVEATELHFAPTSVLAEHFKVGELHPGDRVEISDDHNLVVNHVQTAKYDMYWRLWYRVSYTGTHTGGAWVLARALKKK